MSAAAVLLGFLNVCLYCAVIILIAFALVWILQLVFNIAPSAEVMKWGKIVVALLCIVAIAAWLLGLLGGAPYSGPHFLWGR